MKAKGMLKPRQKKPATGAGSLIITTDRLLDLGFLVHHVLAGNGIVFLDLHFSGHVLFVFVRGVEVTGTF